MHEFSLILNLFEAVEKDIIQQEIHKVVKIHLEMGPLSGAEPILLEQCFEIAKTNTIFADAELVITFIEAEVKCLHCSHLYHPDDFPFLCPKCETFGAQVLRGDGIIIKKVQLEIPEDY